MINKTEAQKNLIYLIIGLLFSLILSACGSGGTTQQSNNAQSSTEHQYPISGQFSITITPQSSIIKQGEIQQYELTAYYPNGESSVVTSGVSWTSSNPSVVSIDSNGLATILSASGTTTISATYEGASAQAELSATAASVTSIAIKEQGLILAPGKTQQYTIIAQYSNGESSVVTSDINWSSSAESIVSITKDGKATTNVLDATAIITAEYEGHKASAELTADVCKLGKDYCLSADEAQRVFTYEQLNDNTLSITGLVNKESVYAELIIPAKINGHFVTLIGDSAFTENRLTNITISPSVTSIGRFAFQGNQLSSVTIPSSVKFIGGEAFHGNQLTDLTIMPGVRFIDDYAFGDNQLTSVTTPSSVEIIGGMAFDNNKLTSVTIMPGVRIIGFWAFQDNQLTSVRIPSSVEFVGGYAFDHNPLTNVIVENPSTKLDSSFGSLCSIGAGNIVTCGTL